MEIHLESRLWGVILQHGEGYKGYEGYHTLCGVRTVRQRHDVVLVAALATAAVVRRLQCMP